MTLVSPTMRDGLRGGRPRVLLAEIDHPDGVVNFWSGIGALVHDGKTWTGTGILGRVGQVGSSVEFGVKGLAFELRGVPATATQFLDSEVRGHTADLWIGVLNPERKIAGGKVLLANALLDHQILAMQSDGKVVIQLIGIMGFYELNRAPSLAWSDEQQKIAFPTDVGLALIPELVNKETLWRLTA